MDLAALKERLAREICTFLARQFEVGRKNVVIVHGELSALKQIVISLN